MQDRDFYVVPKTTNPHSGRQVIDDAEHEAMRAAYRKAAEKHREDNQMYSEYSAQLAHLLGDNELKLLEIWSVSQAALYFRVSTATIYAWIHRKNKQGQPEPYIHAEKSLAMAAHSDRWRYTIHLDEINRIEDIARRMEPNLRRYMPRVAFLAEQQRRMVR